MTAGLAVALANSLLDTACTNALFVQLHTGDPGASGIANVSSVTTRQGIAWNAASGGTKSASTVPNWGNWAGTSPEIIAYLSFWSLVTAGVFQFSQFQANPITVQTGFPLTLAVQNVTIAAIAA